MMIANDEAVNAVPRHVITTSNLVDERTLVELISECDCARLVTMGPAADALIAATAAGANGYRRLF